MARTRKTLAEKLKEHTVNTPAEGCWLFKGRKNKGGYGRLYWDGKYHLAHRIAYELVHGRIPEGLIILHDCDNPPCIRPDHLKVGTHADNTADMIKKGRAGKAFGFIAKYRKAHPKPKLNAVARQRLRTAAKRPGFDVAVAAKKYGVTQTEILRIIRRKSPRKKA